jgi:hypothetical protein
VGCVGSYLGALPWVREVGHQGGHSTACTTLICKRTGSVLHDALAVQTCASWYAFRSASHCCHVLFVSKCHAACAVYPRLGYEVEATTVALAFGIHEPQPSQKEVFAFLPVRRYGLNFIVQVCLLRTALLCCTATSSTSLLGQHVWSPPVLTMRGHWQWLPVISLHAAHLVLVLV